MYESIVQTYIDIIEYCIPFLVVFGFGNLAVSTILRTVFTGRLIVK